MELQCSELQCTVDGVPVCFVMIYNDTLCEKDFPVYKKKIPSLIYETLEHMA